ncbi:MAG: AMP-binding protein [Ilumatobacteraceae bacterium]
MKVALTVNDFLRRAELVYPKRIGVIDEPDQPAESWGTLTFAQLAQRARAQAAGLDALGIGVGDRVAMVSQNSARLLTALFGVSGSGRILVPINFRLVAEEVRYIVEHSGARVLLVDPELEDALADVECEHKYVIGADSDQLLMRYDVDPLPWEGDEDATATINYTSGTTARPKGVQLTHRNVWINATTFGWQLGISDRDVYLHTLPQFHCNGWGVLYAATAVGARHVIIRKIDGAEILRRVDQHGVTLMCCAPAVANAILDAAATWNGPIPGRDRVRMVVAGAPPPTRTIERIETELGWEFIQIYGLTETSPLLTINRGRAETDTLTPGERAAKLSRAGAPAFGVDIRISPDGEVLARSNHVMAGYWEQPDATAAAVHPASDDAEGPDWFHTGDGAVLDDECYVTISDRKKDVIISGGENVSSIEVEDALFSHPDVAEVAVIGVPDEKWGELVMALVVTAPGSTLDEASLIAYCKTKLAGYKCPKRIEFRDELARTATGKLQKFKLREPYWAGRTKAVN